MLLTSFYCEKIERSKKEDVLLLIKDLNFFLTENEKICVTSRATCRLLADSHSPSCLFTTAYILAEEGAAHNVFPFAFPSK